MESVSHLAMVNVSSLARVTFAKGDAVMVMACVRRTFAVAVALEGLATTGHLPHSGEASTNIDRQ